MKSVLCFVIFGFLTVNALSYHHYPGEFIFKNIHTQANNPSFSVSRLTRSSYYPRKTVMFSGYYGNPPSYPGAMTAFLSGDTVATGSYVGQEYIPPAEPEDNIEVLVPKESTQEEQVVEVTEPSVELTTLEELEVTTPKSKRLPKKKKPLTSTTPATPDEEAEEEEDEPASSWPFPSRSNVPAYNTFFPIVFGGYPASKSRNANDESSYPGGATAIANSFSTGKGGVASSHATAFGDPSLASLFRNGGFNFKKRNSPKEE